MKEHQQETQQLSQQLTEVTERLTQTEDARHRLEDELARAEKRFTMDLDEKTSHLEIELQVCSPTEPAETNNSYSVNSIIRYRLAVY